MHFEAANPEDAKAKVLEWRALGDEEFQLYEVERQRQGKRLHTYHHEGCGCDSEFLRKLQAIRERRYELIPNAHR